jgi:MFS family permease
MEIEVKKRPFYGWWLLLLLGITYAIEMGFAFYGPAVILPYMTRSMGWSRGEVMIGLTAIVLLYGLASPVAARVIHHIGARLTLLIGSVTIALSSCLIGLMGQSYEVYILLCVVVGLGVCFGTMLATQTVVVAWFNRRRALAMGLVMGGGGVGGFFSPQLINGMIINTNGNWSTGWFIIAIAAAVGAVIAIIAIRNKPSDLGQYPDGLSQEEAGKTKKGSPVARTYRTPYHWEFRDAIRTAPAWLGVFALGANFFLWEIIRAQGPFHLPDRGFSATDAAFFYSLALAFSIVGRFSVAALGDRIEPRYLFSIGSILILLGGVTFWFVSPQMPWTAYLYPLLAGIGHGAVYVCLPTMLGNYYGSEVFARIYGTTFPIVTILQSVANPVAGFLYDLQGTYLIVSLIGFAGAAFAFIVMFFCKPPKPKSVNPAE